MGRIVESEESGRKKSENRFTLRWNDFRANLSDGFADLLEQKTMVDVTLAADGKYLQAHKLILSVCSSYFKNLFKVNPCKHPIVILKDVGHSELSYMLQFMYRGEVGVREADLPSFLKLGRTLKVKGLTGDKIQSEALSAVNKSDKVRVRKKRRRDTEVMDDGKIEIGSEKKHRLSSRSETGPKVRKIKKCDVTSGSSSNVGTISSESESEDNHDPSHSSNQYSSGDSKGKGIFKTSESDCVFERSVSEEVKISMGTSGEFQTKSDCDFNDDFHNREEEEDEYNVCAGDMEDFGGVSDSRRNVLDDATESDQTPQGHLIITRASRAFVWDYFLKESNKAICLNCGKIFKGQRPNTICEQHLRRMHPEFYKILLEKKIKRAELHMNPAVMSMGIPTYDQD